MNRLLNLKELHGGLSTIRVLMTEGGQCCRLSSGAEGGALFSCKVLIRNEAPSGGARGRKKVSGTLVGSSGVSSHGALL